MYSTLICTLKILGWVLVTLKDVRVYPSVTLGTTCKFPACTCYTAVFVHLLNNLWTQSRFLCLTPSNFFFPSRKYSCCSCQKKLSWLASAVLTNVPVARTHHILHVSKPWQWVLLPFSCFSNHWSWRSSCGSDNSTVLFGVNTGSRFCQCLTSFAIIYWSLLTALPPAKRLALCAVWSQYDLAKTCSCHSHFVPGRQEPSCFSLFFVAKWLSTFDCVPFCGWNKCGVVGYDITITVM